MLCLAKKGVVEKVTLTTTVKAAIKMKLFSPHTEGKHKLLQPEHTIFYGEKFPKEKNKGMLSNKNNLMMLTCFCFVLA